ncbi:MAG: response regulator transcription factor [Gammaproteobacteria bacterium]
MNERQQIVSIIDDDEDVRDSLVELIDSIGLQAKSYASAIHFLDEADINQAGCILADVRMPGMSGIELQHKLNDLDASQPLIIMTGHGDITMAVQAMKDGAFEFLQKPFRDQELLECIAKALELDNKNLNELESQHATQKLVKSLTIREREVIDKVLEGKVNKIIARELDISVRTVEIHRSHAMEKLCVKSVAELVKIMLSIQP